MEIDGFPADHKVACHWAEQIERGEIELHQVEAIAIDPSAFESGAEDHGTIIAETPGSATQTGDPGRGL